MCSLKWARPGRCSGSCQLPTFTSTAAAADALVASLTSTTRMPLDSVRARYARLSLGAFSTSLTSRKEARRCGWLEESRRSVVDAAAAALAGERKEEETEEVVREEGEEEEVEARVVVVVVWAGGVVAAEVAATGTWGMAARLVALRVHTSAGGASISAEGKRSVRMPPIEPRTAQKRPPLRHCRREWAEWRVRPLRSCEARWCPQRSDASSSSEANASSRPMMREAKRGRERDKERGKG
mmetsp:Transcript_36802/g.89618  ORF Transcript_36802/g.89618 Transcript_36802/m.89618 type:complete len:240 (+) Transcript_36802:67-786(+)